MLRLPMRFGLRLLGGRSQASGPCGVEAACCQDGKRNLAGRGKAFRAPCAAPRSTRPLATPPALAPEQRQCVSSSSSSSSSSCSSSGSSRPQESRACAPVARAQLHLPGHRGRCQGQSWLPAAAPASAHRQSRRSILLGSGTGTWAQCRWRPAPVQQRAVPQCQSRDYIGAALQASLPEWLQPGSLAASEHRWVFESFLGLGEVSLGLPGLVSLAIFVNPMFEAMPRIRRQASVGRLPLLPYSAMAAQGMVWTFYGALLSNPAIWTPNLTAMLLGLWYWQTYLRHCPAQADWLPGTRAQHLAGVLATTIVCVTSVGFLSDVQARAVLGLLGNAMTITMFGGPLAAMRTVIQERSTRSMPFGFTCAVNANCNLWFFYAYFMLNDPYIFLQDGIGLLLTTAQLALFCRYGIQR